MNVLLSLARDARGRRLGLCVVVPASTRPSRRIGFFLAVICNNSLPRTTLVFDDHQPLPVAQDGMRSRATAFFFFQPSCAQLLLFPAFSAVEILRRRSYGHGRGAGVDFDRGLFLFSFHACTVLLYTEGGVVTGVWLLVHTLIFH